MKLNMSFSIRAAALWCAGLTMLLAPCALRADSNPALQQWLATQTNVSTWSAEVTQTRMLKTLTQPLTARGRIWFAAPNSFRWEIGDPPQTVAVRKGDEMVVSYPKLKRAERYELNGAQMGQWRETLSLMEAGFPRTQADVESRFKILSVTTSNETHHIQLQPKSTAARRMMPELRITVGASDHALRGTELHFADGSVLRNEFTNAVLNAPIPEKTFAPGIGPDYKVTEPLKQR